jgi:HlyD family secretion protein
MHPRGVVAAAPKFEELTPDEEDERDATLPDLETALRPRKRKPRWRQAIVCCVLLGAVASVILWRRHQLQRPVYSTHRVAIGEVVETVRALGSVQPLVQVNVGSQVSGRVARVHVDFNSVVKEGDILAEIDSSLFGAQVTQAKASVASQFAQLQAAQATARTAKLGYERTEKLFLQGLASKVELEQARGQLEVTHAQVAGAQAQKAAAHAQLGATETNASLTRLYAPIDGMVINRSIDTGATVVASFQASTLFVIAHDLKRMRIVAEVDEADVGKLKTGMQARAIADAFPGEAFTGTLPQLRYFPSNTQGVVTYGAVIEVENPEEKLRPGMTATITIRTRESLAALRVPNAALRFTPKSPVKENGVKRGRRVYVETGAGVIEEREVGILFSDGVFSVATSGLNEGDCIVLDEGALEALRGAAR